MRALRDPRLLVKRFDRALSPLFGHTDYARFIVLSRSRTGSNFLVSLLNSHPNVAVDGEVFGRVRGEQAKDVLKRSFGREGRSIRAKGFKIFYYHPLDDPRGEVWEVLEALEDLRVIHLKRRNLLRVLVSRKIAEAANQWSHSRSSVPPSKAVKSVVIRPEEVRLVFAETRRWERQGDARFQRHTVYSLYYEDLVADTASTVNAVLAVLRVRPAPLTTTFRRQNPEPLEALIRNFDELRSAFEEDPLRSYFDD